MSLSRIGLLSFAVSAVTIPFLHAPSSAVSPAQPITAPVQTSLFSPAPLVRPTAPPGVVAPTRPAPLAVLASETLELTGLQSRFEEVARSVSPAVLAISASVIAPATDDVARAEELNGQKLEHILDQAVRTVGTGFVIDANGYLLTNEHVIAGAESLWVTTDDGKVYPALVVGSDPRADLAVLKIPASHLPTVHFALAQTVHRGQWTIALGNPYGLAGSGEMAMSVGVVSAIDRSLPKLASKEHRLYSNLIQTTAEINPGNSGGPLFDISGQVIGINTAVILPQKQTNGIGFAMPITPRLLDVVAQLKQGNEIQYGYLGVTIVTPTERERKEAGLPTDVGALVQAVETRSPAANANLRPSDVITSMNGTPIRDGDQLVRLIGETAPAVPADIALVRNGKPLTLAVHLAQYELPTVAITRQNQRLHWRGMLLGPLPENWGQSAATPDTIAANTPSASPHGLLVIAVDKNSPAEKMEVAQGAILHTVAGQPVNSVADLQSILNNTPADLCTLDLIAPPASLVAAASHDAAPK